MLITDYLVVGAGAAAMAFIDTLLTQSSQMDDDLHVIVIDQHDRPGGHWNDAYGYVRLHQPSLLYGVSSRPLEGNWWKLVFTRGVLPWQHRANRDEILTYYDDLMSQWIASGKVRYFPRSTYHFAQDHVDDDDEDDNDTDTDTKGDGTNTCDGDDEDNSHTVVHRFTDHRTGKTHVVKVREKLVNGVVGECRVPSTTPPKFPVSPEVTLVTPNQVYDMHVHGGRQEQARAQQDGSKADGWYGWFRHGWYAWFRQATGKPKTGTASSDRYVVLGAGKTAMDTVVFLQQTLGIPADDITWVIPHDVWMLRREAKGGGPWAWGSALLAHDLNVTEAALALEREGIVTRLDPDVRPTQFRFPVVGRDELRWMRRIRNVVRRGRVTEIARRTTDGKIAVSFTDGGQPWVLEEDVTAGRRCVFVHCTSPGPFNGHQATAPFVSPEEIRLELLYAPPVPISMSCIAALECQRRKGRLDLDLGRKIVGPNATDTEVLATMLSGYRLATRQGGDAQSKDGLQHIYPLVTLASFLALFDRDDPAAGYQWMKKNRLSFFSIPGFKGKVYESILGLIAKREFLGLEEHDVSLLHHVADKLVFLEGKES